MLRTTTNPSEVNYVTGGNDGLGYVTTYEYDGLNRPTLTTFPGDAKITYGYWENLTSIIDPANSQRFYYRDALGRLQTVREQPNGPQNYTTTYEYDAQNNLTKVNQSGQIRTFAYDRAGRLTDATNPETGATPVHYDYDGAGNLTQRKDGRNTAIAYGYDLINRLASKTYYDGITRQVLYTYDDPNVANSMGRLTRVENGSAMNYTAYDVLDRVTASNQQVAGVPVTYNFCYKYDLAGALTSERYPSGRVVTTEYDGVNRESGVSGTLNGVQTNYASSALYAPHGGIVQFAMGNSVTPWFNYNSRLQMTVSQAVIAYDPLQYLFVEESDWGTTNNNGNLQSVTVYAGGPAPLANLPVFTTTFGYDALNRINGAWDSNNYARGYNYDAYGNMWVTGAWGGPWSGSTPISDVYDGSNRIAGGSYDAAGNQLVVNGNTIAYDAENRQVSATDTSNAATERYFYDGTGQRVEKSGPSGTTTYVYDAFGQLAAEYTDGTAAATPCTTCYLTYDHLGSVRLVTDQNGSVVARHDYLPFGEEFVRGGEFGANDGVNQRFTGQFRDSETGLDFFESRYLSGALGRFTSPDEPFAGQDTADPQSWNLYSYALNNPLRYTDPTGHEEEDSGVTFRATGTGYLGLDPLEDLLYRYLFQDRSRLAQIGQQTQQMAQQAFNWLGAPRDPGCMKALARFTDAVHHDSVVLPNWLPRSRPSIVGS